MAQDIILLGKLENSAVASSKSRDIDLTDRDAAKYISKIVNVNGHAGVTEHDVYCIELNNITLYAAEIIGSRRIGISIVQKSYRYCDSVRFAWEDRSNHFYLRVYQRMLLDGLSNEDARYSLPVTVGTDMVITINRRSLVHLIKILRVDANYDCHLISEKLLSLLQEGRWIESTLANSPDMEDEEYIDDIYFLDAPAVEIMKLNVIESHNRSDELTQIAITGRLSMVAYNQLKRHRLATIIPGKYSTIDFHSNVPEAITMIAAVDNAMLNGSLRYFYLQCNLREWKDIVRLRTARSTQKELREYITDKDIIVRDKLCR